MSRLRPFEKLEEDDDYANAGWQEESGDELSSDDELQAELRKIAGIPTKCEQKRGQPAGEFEDDMEDELDRSICDYADKHMSGKDAGPSSQQEDVQMVEVTSSTTAEDEQNPIRQLANKAKKEAEREEVEFYDPDEDDDNEKWMEERSRKAKGEASKTRGKIDNDSDAVLSCPGCMNLLTRDCQRHELYKDQYRAMFVENCDVDMEDKLTIEKTGKEKRRQRQKQKKSVAMTAATESSTGDAFYPVRCRICKTKVAVMDNDEVYHFFNVLAGYA